MVTRAYVTSAPALAPARASELARALVPAQALTSAPTPAPAPRPSTSFGITPSAGTDAGVPASPGVPPKPWLQDQHQLRALGVPRAQSPRDTPSAGHHVPATLRATALLCWDTPSPPGERLVAPRAVSRGGRERDHPHQNHRPGQKSLVGGHSGFGTTPCAHPDPGTLLSNSATGWGWCQAREKCYSPTFLRLSREKLLRCLSAPGSGGMDHSGGSPGLDTDWDDPSPEGRDGSGATRVNGLSSITGA